MAWPWTSPELLRLWLTSTRSTRLLRISVRSRTLAAGTACSGPGRRATAETGSSSEQHSRSKTEGRIIHSPQRIRVDHMSDFMKSHDKNRAPERWQSAEDWHSDGTLTTPPNPAESKDSYNSL
ncbi:hypothetical protein D3C85_1447560 [compost metagenome]